MDPFKSQRYKVFWDKDDLMNGDRGSRCIIFSPADTSWNDFGYQTYIHVEIRCENRVYEEDCLIGILADKKFDTRDLWDAVPKWQLSPENPMPLPYFTVFPSLDNYREIVTEFGNEEASEALCAMKDYAATTEFGGGRATSWINKIKLSGAFIYSIKRRSEAYFAALNAGSILQGLDQESLDRAPNEISISHPFEEDGYPPVLDFRFDGPFGKRSRVCMIIGENGTGKSQTLSKIVQVGISKRKSLQDSKGETATVSRILALAPTVESGRVFPYDNVKNPSTWYRRFTLNQAKSGKSNTSLAESILQLSNQERSIAGKPRWEIFLEAIKALNNSNEIAFKAIDHRLRSEFKQSFSRKVIFMADLVSGGDMATTEARGAVSENSALVRVVKDRTLPLSSGEASFIRFAGYVCQYVENGSLLLLDEPETHLHPQFISRFMKLLNDLLQMTGSIAIVATHSPYFVREVFSEQVTVLDRGEDGSVQIKRPMMRTYGADIGAISRFVFGDQEPSLLAQGHLDSLVEQHSNWEDFDKEFGGDFSSEFLMRLRRKMVGKGS